MIFKNHIIFSIAIVIFVKKIDLLLENFYLDICHMVVGSVMFCLLPDIDHSRSVVRKYLNCVFYVKIMHRGFTHSFLFVFFIFIFFKLFIYLDVFNVSIDILYGMLVGYCSHIIADMLTTSGVCLFWPLKFRVKLFLFSYLTKNRYLENKFCLFFLFLSIQFFIWK